MGRFATWPGGRWRGGVLDDKEQGMNLENVAWFGLGFALGYYAMAHYKRTGKAL
jgi:hypothetical protein